MLLRSIVFIIFLASHAQAGAWMREPGEHFVAPSYSMLQNPGGGQRSFAGVFYEMGITPSLTVGLDAGTQPGGFSQALVFVRTPLRESPNGVKVAADFAIGSIDADVGYEAALRSGLSLGYGFGTRDGNGWVGLETSALWASRSNMTRIKLDLTAGMTVSPNLKLMVQWHTDHEIGGPTYNLLVPSAVIATGPRQNVQIGLQIDPNTPGSYGLKLSLWQTF